ncbi:MAG: hypothetical protein RIG62_29805 [Cyclobacteriaceae bacterium]
MRYKFLLTAGLALALFSSLHAQEKKFSRNSNWSTLAKISYKTIQDPYGPMSVPEFNEAVKAMEGEEIELSGYIIPLDGLEGAFQPTHFILSSLPLSACFFCGSGGPESVVEVQLEDAIEYTTDPITLRGKLKLNGRDPYQMIYILQDAEFVEVVGS